MNAKAATGGVRGVFLVVLAAGIGAAIGLPVGSWAAAVLLVCVACAGFAHLVGLRDAAKGFGRPILWSAALAMGAPMLGAIVTRTVSSDPDVRWVAGVIAVVVVLAAVGVLLAKIAAPAHGAKHQAKPTLRARARIVEPVVTPAPLRATSTRNDASDDLGLYGGRRGHR